LQEDGRKLAGNLPAMKIPDGAGEIMLGGNPVLGVGAELAPGLQAFSGNDISYIAAARARLMHVMFWLFGGALVLATVSGALVSRSVLARMDAIGRTCRAIMTGNLKDRIPIRGSQDELDRLAATINAMLDRIAALMENLRQVSSDIAHDLRTPLSHLRLRLERARAEAASPAEYQAALDGAIGATDEMLSLFAALLRIAQIEGGTRRAGFAPMDLGALLQKLKDVYGAVAEDSGHDLMVKVPPPLQLRGDPELLFQLFANLVENAIVHTPPGTAIAVAADIGADRIAVHVRDSGPGVAPAERGRLFQRFYRGDASRTKPGHGLGLSLAAAVAELHGGAIAIGDGPGMDFRVTLPLEL
jgi:signal transduction histidine kinase